MKPNQGCADLVKRDARASCPPPLSLIKVFEIVANDIRAVRTIGFEVFVHIGVEF